jgi:phage nucleotide-binding protein
MEQQEFENELRKWLADGTQQVSSVTTKRRLRALFYGDFDSGKTTLAGQIIKAMSRKAIFFYTDSNFVVLQKDPEVAKLIDIKPFENYTQLRVFAHAHTNNVEGFSDYDTLVLDTASTAVYRILRTLVKNIKFEDQRHRELESWSHYNLVRAKSLELIEELNKSDLNIIYLCHDQDPTKSEQGQTNETRVLKKFAARPNMPEKTFNVFAGEVSLVGWLFKEDERAKRKVTFEGTLRRMAKSQIPGIEEKTYEVEEIPELIRKWQQS